MADIPTPSDTDRSEELRSQIDAAIKAGGNLNEIINHLSSSEDPFHQAYARRLKGEEVQNDEPAMRPVPKQEDQTQTPLINASQHATTGFLDLPLEQQIGYGAAGLGALGATGLAMYAGKEAIRNKISKAMNPESPEFKRQNDLSERRLALAEAEAAKTEALNPIQQAKIEAIRAENARKQEAHDQKLALEKEAHLARLNKNVVSVAGGKNIPPELTYPEITPGLAKLESDTGGALGAVSDVDLANIAQAQQNRKNAPATPPATTPAPVTPPVNPPVDPLKVAEAATPPSTLQGGAPVQPGGDVTVDENALKEAALNSSEKALNPELATNVQTKTDLQNEQIKNAILQQDQAAKAAQTTPPAPEAIQQAKPAVEIPEGRIPNYMEFKTKKGGSKEFKNKQGEDVIGKGGWNWYQSQVGPEVAQKNWEKAFGQTNQTYEKVKEAIASGKLEGAPVDEMGRGGKFGREPHVPNYIKGNVDIGMMAGLLATGGIGALTAYMAKKYPDFATQYQKALEASGEATGTEGLLKSNKAEELSPAMRKIIIKSGNQSYRSEINKQLQTEKQAERIKELQRELSKAK